MSLSFRCKYSVTGVPPDKQPHLLPFLQLALHVAQGAAVPDIVCQAQLLRQFPGVRQPSLQTASQSRAAVPFRLYTLVRFTQLSEASTIMWRLPILRSFRCGFGMSLILSLSILFQNFFPVSMENTVRKMIFVSSHSVRLYR